MYVLLTRLQLQLPPVPDINMRVVFEALFFLQEPLPIPIPNPISDSTSAEEKYDFNEENTIPCVSQTTTEITASVILGRLLHVLSFHLEFSRDEWSETVKKRHSGRYTSSTMAPTTSHALCLAGALLSVVLLLDQQQQEKRKAEKKEK
ncbi:hypothetical protein LSM04_000615 [Trypanosoma melophagium]|nr:hypothetical protein LSM04_000615 [Trypanosoma melophagium]